MAYLIGTSGSITNGSVIPLDTLTPASGSGFTLSSGVVTVPTTGYYLVSYGVTISSGTAPILFILSVDSDTTTLSHILNQNWTLAMTAGILVEQLNAGQTLSIRNVTGSSVTFNSTTGGLTAYIIITRLQ